MRDQPTRTKKNLGRKAFSTDLKATTLTGNDQLNLIIQRAAEATLWSARFYAAFRTRSSTLPPTSGKFDQDARSPRREACARSCDLH